jgi:hypothetical protein
MRENTAMATASPAAGWRTDQPFFVRMMIGISVLIVFGFVQFAARGMVDIGRVPPWVHLHGVTMLGWLALIIQQGRLAGQGAIEQHRRLGRIGLVLAVFVALLGAFTGFMAVKSGTQPPFFAPGYFLALTVVGMTIFLAVILFAISLRRDTDWHRRIMLVALILILEPALGRILPIPLLQPHAQWYELALQLATLGLVMRHDAKHRGAVHPALLWGAAILIGTHLVFFALGQFPPWIALAEGIVAT